MKSTWVVGDVHGCAAELQLLIEKIDLQEGDSFLSVGDLFHRGPDPAGVLRLLQDIGPRFDMVNGNHEHALLRRLQGNAAQTMEDLRGDGRATMAPNAWPVAQQLLAFIKDRDDLQRRPLSGPAWQGCAAKQWLLVHGCELPSQPFEYENWQGPEFVVFGHIQSAAGERRNENGEPCCYGLDTGCVYGGKLTALRVEDLVTVEIPAVGARV